MTTYRAGQRVRIEWPNGDVLEGGVVDGLDGTHLVRGWWLDSHAAPLEAGTAVTILAEPIPKEPTGLGAVVEALFHSPGTVGEARQVWVRRVLPAHVPQEQKWVSEDARWYAAWEHLEDPVVLSEGWHRE